MVVMERLTIVSLLFLLGTVLGSFAGAQVWRLRARQLAEEKREGEEYDKAEYARLRPLLVAAKHDYSRCLACGTRLRWYDLLPLVSWLSTGGRWRYCKRAIGGFEPLMELSLGVLFALSFLTWPFPLNQPLEWVLFGVWLAAGVCLAILFAYDYRWKLLPNWANLLFIALGGVWVVVRIVAIGDVQVLSLAGALLLLSGLYWLLYIMSKGRWIGFGDVKLGIGLALFLSQWQLAFLALFLANLLGCVVVLPGVLRRSLSVRSEVAFGPLLVIGMVLSLLYGQRLLEWFMSLRLFY